MNERLIAIIRLVCTLIVSIAAGAGLALDADMIYTVIMCILALVCFIWSWWKNNNITTAAQDAQELLDIAKVTIDRRDDDEEVSEEEEEEADE